MPPGVQTANHPQFGYASGFDADGGRYIGLVYGQLAPTSFPTDAVLVRKDVAAAQQEQVAVPPVGPGISDAGRRDRSRLHCTRRWPVAPSPAKPTRFYGSVEIDPTRPIKAFDTVINAVVEQLQRTQGSRVKLTLEIEADAPGGFDDVDVSVVRDNAKQQKFRAESTGFD